MKSDKELERDRYEFRARDILSGNSGIAAEQNEDDLPPAILAPYLCYKSRIRELVSGGQTRALEIGAGTGKFTETLLQTGAKVTAIDISESSLRVLKRRFEIYENLSTRVADMEALPFENGTFDFVLNAGSLSYGDNGLVMDEIYRVLKSGGRFICVDSLNHNYFYRFNRWVQYLRKKRSRSTLERMPTEQLIDAYADRFGHIEKHYFGAIIWATPVLDLLFNSQQVGRLSAWIDRMFNVSKAAFKFVMVVEKVRQ